MVDYAVIESTIPGIDKCIATICGQKSRTLDDVIDHMIAEGTGLTRPQALAYFEKIVQIFEYFVQQGHRVVTPLVSVQPSIKGNFEDTEDMFDSSRHRIRIRSSSGIRMRKLESSVRLNKVDNKFREPAPKSLFDGTFREKNTKATPSGIASLYGKDLKFDQEDTQQGIFFISSTDVETRVDVYNRIKPAEVGFQIPALTSGEYTVEIRTISRTGGKLKKGILKKQILIE